MSKTFTIYTSSADSSKVLKKNVQIALTVTPADQSKLFTGDQSPVVWKAWDFIARSDTTQSATWVSQPAFAVAGNTSEAIACNVGNAVVLTTNGLVQGSTLNPAVQGQQDNVMARNRVNIKQTFLLGSIDGSGTYNPFLRLAATNPNDGAVTLGPGVKLQAYGVQSGTYAQPSGDGQLLESTDKGNYIFRTYDGTASPIDLPGLTNNTTYLLYSNTSGQLVLEAQ
ncbi:unnamed protein product [Somion occarium]|uniref:Uncharacterized protein n=1 Tax=Somion occarium TaxID=3059160 RepID=A0ABP1CMK1_9APHY